MSVQTRPAPGRSDRDKLEKLQEQLREARARRASLQREKDELLARTGALEAQVRGLRRAFGMSQGELERPAPSLPDELLPPFHVSPAQRTVYGRLRTALKLLPASVVLCAHMALGLLVHPAFFLSGIGIMAVALLVLLLVIPSPEDGDVFPHWSFDAEGFFPTAVGSSQGKVLYREIQRVSSRKGLFQRLSGLGSVEVVWTPEVPTSLGNTADPPHRIVKLKLIQEPDRLASWLRKRAPGTGSGSEGAARVD